MRKGSRGVDEERAYLHGHKLHAIIEENAARIAQEESERREGQAYKWLRQNWPWYLRWAIGYPRIIAVLDRLGLVVLPVFVEEHDC